MPAEETVILYGGHDKKDTWTHNPEGGTGWERTKKEGVLEPAIPAEIPNINTTGEKIETIQVEPFTIPKGKEVASAELHVYLAQENAAAGGLLSLNAGFAEPLAETTWTGKINHWIALHWNKTLTQEAVTEMNVTAHSNGGTGKQAIRALYFLLKLREKEEPPPPPPSEVGGSVPRGKTGTPPYRGHPHSEFGPIDVVEEERHYIRTLSRLLFGAVLIGLILLAVWGLFNSWGDAAVIKTVETIGEKL